MQRLFVDYRKEAERITDMEVAAGESSNAASGLGLKRKPGSNLIQTAPQPDLVDDDCVS